MDGGSSLENHSACASLAGYACFALRSGERARAGVAVFGRSRAPKLEPAVASSIPIAFRAARAAAHTLGRRRPGRIRRRHRSRAVNVEW